MIEYETKKRNEINEYNSKYKEWHNNYFISVYMKTDANFGDITKLKDDDIYELSKQYINPNYIRSQLLKLEMMNYSKESKDTNVNQTVEMALDLLKRYQHKADGYEVEEVEWTVHTNESKEFDVMEGEVLLSNTIPICAYDNKETTNYLETMEKIFNTLSTNVSVDLRYLKKKSGGVYYVFMWFTNKSNNNVPEIGL